MKKKMSWALVLFVFWTLFISGCTAISTPDHPVSTDTPEKNDVTVANPATVYCEKQGYLVETRTAADGSQSAVCIFPNGSECDEWAYFRGECRPGTLAPKTENKAVEAAKIFLARQLGLDASQITLFSLETIIWLDSCLGIPGQGEACNPKETAGFRVILTIGETHYTFHTDLTGENIRQETAGAQGG